MPVFGPVASRFNDAGITALYGALVRMFADKGLDVPEGTAPSIGAGETGAGTAIVPPGHQHYLAEVAATVRDYHRDAAEQARIARERQQLTAARRMLEAAGRGARHKRDLDALVAEREAALEERCRALLDGWPKMKERYAAEAPAAEARGADVRTGLVGTVEVRYAGERIRAVNTTPESLDLQRALRNMRTRGVDAVVMEVSSHGLELGRVAGCRFTVGAFTNLSQDHLDFHAGMDAYRDAKVRLFRDHLAPGAGAVVNIDDAAAPAFLTASKTAGARQGRPSSATLCHLNRSTRLHR